MLVETDVIAGALHGCSSAVTNVSDVTRHRLSDDKHNTTPGRNNGLPTLSTGQKNSGHDAYKSSRSNSNLYELLETWRCVGSWTFTDVSEGNW
jgi:hypothetical protein